MKNPNTQYNTRPWGSPPQPEVPSTPRNYEEFAEQQALAPVLGTVTDDEIRDQGIPSLPQVQRFRPREGYRDTSLSISDCFSPSSVFPDFNFLDRSTGKNFPVQGPNITGNY